MEDGCPCYTKGLGAPVFAVEATLFYEISCGVRHFSEGRVGIE
jgi:hypothetical protein